MSADVLVSSGVLHDRIAKFEAEVEAQRRFRVESDAFFLVAAWCVEEWRAALKDAEQQYVSTAEAARLTGWSAQTLRKWGTAVMAAEVVPAEWSKLIARRDGGSDMAFCVSSIPVKGSSAS